MLEVELGLNLEVGLALVLAVELDDVTARTKPRTELCPEPDPKTPISMRGTSMRKNLEKPSKTPKFHNYACACVPDSCTN